MERRSIAYTGDDLIAIGKIVKRITRRLKAFEAYSESDIEANIYDMKMNVLWEEEVVGYVGYEDGWIGFFPYAVNFEGNTEEGNN